MTNRVLTLRELGRATLARQMILERAALTVPEAVGRLVGLQAQVPDPPYIGLWTRLEGFLREDLTLLMHEQRIVRAAMMRSTLHLVTAEDHGRLRPALEPALERALTSFFGGKARDLDVAELVAAARAYLEEKPRSTGELRDRLSALFPDQDPDAMAYAVRTHLPLVQVPPGGTWGSGSRATYTTAESRLGRPPSRPEHPLHDLLLRYLAAFGPASVRDFQAWSGLVRLKGPVEELKGELRSFRDEHGNELLDLLDAPLPAPDIPAPVRFVPEYDNLLLSHADRRRTIADEHRKEVFLSAARVRATFLVDGFVAGTWKVERTRKKTTLVVEPFERLSGTDRRALLEEGEGLVRFMTKPDGEEAHEVRFAQRA